MKDYDKPFKTFTELADLLRDRHGLIAQNQEEIVRALRFVPYYDLVNGYKEILMKGERFIYPLSISDLLFFHAFDRNFQNSLMTFSITIEDYFKNALAYTIGEDFSVNQDDYLADGHYLRRKQAFPGHNITRAFVLRRLRHIAAVSNDNPTCYYRENHNHIPPWILLKNTSFSLTTNLFTLLRNPQKKSIVDAILPGEESWDQRFPVLLYSLTMIRKCRNIIAHNLKFSSFNSSQYMNHLSRRVLRSMISPSLLTNEELSSGDYLTGVYGYIVLALSLMPNGLTKAALLNHLLSAMNMDGLWSTDKLRKGGQTIKRIYFDGLHIPQDVEIRLLVYLKEMF